MLGIPEKNFPRSIGKHNIKIDVCADWIEASVLFDGETVTDSNIIDALFENHVYDSQDFARDFFDNVLRELNRRSVCLGKAAVFERESSHLKPTKSWEDAPAYAFCLLISLAELYPAWAKKQLTNYSQQGELFELITEAALKDAFPGWEACRVGWAPGKPEKLQKVAETVAKCLRDSVLDVSKWADGAAQDAGLDIVLYRPFSDERCSLPAYLFQCASGAYENKFHTPNLGIWEKLVDFSSRPRKAFATPYTFDEKSFRINSNKVRGPLFDRYRLIVSSKEEKDWLPSPLSLKLSKWIKPKLSKLPRLTD